MKLIKPGWMKKTAEVFLMLFSVIWIVIVLGMIFEMISKSDMLFCFVGFGMIVMTLWAASLLEDIEKRR